MTTNPSFVFSYLPSPAKPSAVTSTASASLYDQTATFLQSARRAFTAPRLTAEQSRVALLQQTKQHLEEYASFKAKAGLSSEAAEVEQVKVVQRELAALEGGRK